ncbi:hypothetical protein ACR71G_03435 [Xenorhabdus bovienii]|uniref:hypothetical protein n=1 Tax=Xenorhabdus bovienii TaxID=40576 RepID=UPI003DA3CA53
MKKPKNIYVVKYAETGTDGWSYGRPSGIKPCQWPRSRVNGVPMAHIFTVKIPAEYNVRGSDVEYLSVFQSSDFEDDEEEGVNEFLQEGSEALDNNAFWQELVLYRNNMHPREVYQVDEIGGGWCFIYLTEEEVSGKPSELPSKNCLPVDYESMHEINCFSCDQPARYLNLEPYSDDPNIGIKPEEYPDWLEAIEDTEAIDSLKVEDIQGYIPIFHEVSEKLNLNLDKYFYNHHFGGTAHPAQSIPDELSEFYFEFDETLGDPNIGGDGVAQIDLLTNKIHWACG